MLFRCCLGVPPCAQYSPARTTAKTPRDLEGADRLVQRAIFLIEYFNPKYWFIENPWRGLLRHRSVVASLPPPKKVSYCMYGASYQKHTCIWTNADIDFKSCQGGCGQMVGRRHKSTAQKGPDKGREGHPTCILQSIPPNLCRHICVFINGLDQTNFRGSELPGAGTIEEGFEESEHSMH